MWVHKILVSGVLALSIWQIVNAVDADPGLPQNEPWEVLWPTTGSADRNFEIYRDVLARTDVSVGCPDGYKPVNMEGSSRSDFFVYSNFGDNRPTAKYVTGLRSSDGNAVFIYPSIAVNVGTMTLDGNGRTIADELRAAYQDSRLDVRPLVDVIAKEDMSHFAGADTVAIYNFDLDKIGLDYMGKYNHCLGVYLRKKGHPGLMLKIMLNDKAYNDKDKYLRVLLDNVHYGDANTPLMQYEAKMKGSPFDFASRPDEAARSDEKLRLRKSQSLGELRRLWKAECDSLDRL